MRRAGLLLWGLGGCSGGAPGQTGPTTDTAEAALERPPVVDGPRFLRRVSLDLTGGLPSVAALERVQADPTALDAEIAVLLADARVEERLVHLLDERWHVRTDVMPVGPEDYEMPEEVAYTLRRAIGEEPLRLMAHIAVQDRPWSEVVQTDELRATPLLASLWPVSLEETVGEGEWGRAHWTDARPANGVLASNGLWWRYNTTAFNFNRTRAAAISRLLLCEDYLTQAVQFESPSLTDQDGTEEAVRNDPSCLACHATLDPIAASLFGFWSYDLYDPLELSSYHPEREPLGEDFLQVSPAWFGTPLYNVSDLGMRVAEDPRFLPCAVETFTEGLWRRSLGEGDEVQREVLLSVFVAAGQQVRPLLAAVTRTAAYVGDLQESPPDDARPRLLGPQQLSVVVEQATGLSWTYQGSSMLDSDDVGLRTALGGVDGIEVTAPKYDPDVVQSLAWRSVAEVAAHAAMTPLSEGSSALFPGVTTETTPEDPAFAAALDHAWWWLTATAPDPEVREGLTAIWQAAAAEGGAPEGWAALVSALLQDPLTLTY